MIFEKIKKVIFPSDRRKDKDLRDAIDQFQNVVEKSTEYYLKVANTQSAIERLYNIEKRRSGTMQGVLNALEFLINRELSFDEQIDSVLKILINTTDCERAFLYKKNKDELKIINEVGLYLDDKDKTQNLTNYPSLTAPLLLGKPIFLHKEQFTKKEILHLPEKLKSICLLPLFKKKFWGLLGMSIYNQDVTWDDYDKIMLSSFGNIVTGIIDKHDGVV